MSWSVSSKGKAADVAADIASNAHVPQPIKDLVSLLAEGATNDRDGLEVVTHGHHGGPRASCGNAEVKINPISLAPPAPVPDSTVAQTGAPTQVGETLAQTSPSTPAATGGESTGAPASQ